METHQDQLLPYMLAMLGTTNIRPYIKTGTRDSTEHTIQQLYLAIRFTLGLLPADRKEFAVIQLFAVKPPQTSLTQTRDGFRPKWSLQLAKTRNSLQQRGNLFIGGRWLRWERRRSLDELRLSFLDL